MSDAPKMAGSVSGPVIEKFWPKVIAWAFPQFKRGEDYDFGDEDNLATLEWSCDGAPGYAMIKAAGAEFKRKGDA